MTSTMIFLPADYVISLEDFTLEDDGTMDTVVTFRPRGYDVERTFRYSTEFAADWRDMTGMLRFTDFLRDVVIEDVEQDPDLWA